MSHLLRLLIAMLIVLCAVRPADAGTTAAEVLIPASQHPMAQSLRAWLTKPAANLPTPACLIVHGSGGLFREPANPGDACLPQLESNFARLAQLLADHGVASLMPSSFASRDSRFCEDNDDAFFAFAPAPFINPGDVPARDAAYDTRRVVIRTLDLLAAADYLCADPAVDCSRLCLIGASNGSTTLLAYSAQDLPRHFAEFVDISQQREHESGSAFSSRQLALENFPSVPASAVDRLAARPIPLFAEAVSPGCGMRSLIPTIDPTSPAFDPEQDLTDLYYPTAPIDLHLDIGTADSVPDGCYDGGIRETQARAFEVLTDIEHSRYRIHTFDGAGHDLLVEVGDSIHANIRQLVNDKFFPAVFGNGFEPGAVGENPATQSIID